MSKNMPWTGFVSAAVVGGIVAHVREWDATHPGLTFKQHCMMLLRRSIMASLAGYLWYHATIGFNWQASPFAYMGAAVVGLFAPEFFDLLWSVGKKILTRQIDIDVEHKNKKKKGSE